jgi:hypothetical protein
MPNLPQFSLPFGLPDLPWWAWVLGATVAILICLASGHIATEASTFGGLLFGLIALVTGLTGILMGAMGIIGLIKLFGYD